MPALTAMIAGTDRSRAPSMTMSICPKEASARTPASAVTERMELPPSAVGTNTATTTRSSASAPQPARYRPGYRYFRSVSHPGPVARSGFREIRPAASAVMVALPVAEYNSPFAPLRNKVSTCFRRSPAADEFMNDGHGSRLSGRLNNDPGLLLRPVG